MTYKAHINSRRWSRIRMRLINQRGPRCENCGKLKRLHLHHLNYLRVGRELDSDLQLLCTPCHATTHGLPLPVTP